MKARADRLRIRDCAYWNELVVLAADDIGFVELPKQGFLNPRDPLAEGMVHWVTSYMHSRLPRPKTP